MVVLQCNNQHTARSRDALYKYRGIVMREYAKGFYKSKAWKDCRAAYAKSRGGLCEICLSEGRYTPGVIVHHKRHINPDNITDLTVILDWNNLQLLCRDCHAKQHSSKEGQRYSIDEAGRVII